MISIYNLKPKFQQLLKPVVSLLYTWGVTANQITIASIILSFFISVVFWKADLNPMCFLALPIGLLVRMALNALDGMMARIYNQQSKKGELLNEMGDIISDVFIFFPLLKFELEITYLVVVFICLAIINEFAGIMGKVISNERRYEGPMGKSDRAFVLSLYGLLSYFWIGFHQYTFYLFCGLIFLLIISTSTRLIKSLR